MTSSREFSALCGGQRRRNRDTNIFNLGNSSPVSLNTLVETIESVMGKKAERELYPLPPGDVNRTYADTRHANAVLDYDAATVLRDGLKRQWERYK